MLVVGRQLEYFSQAGFDMDRLYLKRNASVAQLYEDAIRYEGAVISATGALINFSGKKTGRSPKDKRIVFEPGSKDNIWWGSVNIKMDEHTFEINRERAIDYLNTRDNVYVFDGYAGVSSDVIAKRGTVQLIRRLAVGSEVPHQGPGHLRSGLSRPVHGTSHSRAVLLG